MSEVKGYVLSSIGEAPLAHPSLDVRLTKEISMISTNQY